jgi:hypothetical protein
VGDLHVGDGPGNSLRDKPFAPGRLRDRDADEEKKDHPRATALPTSKK